MQCPLCQVNLVMADRQGVEIDYCPQCRGVWLDRGELDKIVERAAQGFQPASSPRASSPPRPASHGGHYVDPRHSKPRRHKHENPVADFFGDLFDFD